MRQFLMSYHLHGKDNSQGFGDAQFKANRLTMEIVEEVRASLKKQTGMGVVVLNVIELE